jgi:hypothetical protein
MAKLIKDIWGMKNNLELRLNSDQLLKTKQITWKISIQPLYDAENHFPTNAAPPTIYCTGKALINLQKEQTDNDFFLKLIELPDWYKDITIHPMIISGDIFLLFANNKIEKIIIKQKIILFRVKSIEERKSIITTYKLN